MDKYEMITLLREQQERLDERITAAQLNMDSVEADQLHTHLEEMERLEMERFFILLKGRKQGLQWVLNQII